MIQTRNIDTFFGGGNPDVKYSTGGGRSAVSVSDKMQKGERMSKISCSHRRSLRYNYNWFLLVLLWVISCIHVCSSASPELQDELLKFLGMKRPTHRVTKVPNFMHELYSKDRQIFNMPDELDDPVNYFKIDNDPLTGSLDTVRSIANITEVGNVTEIREGVGRIRLKFSIDGLPSEERLHAAQLRITHSPRKVDTDTDDANHPNSVTGADDMDLSDKKFKKDHLPYVNYLRVYDVVRILPDNEQVLRLLDTTLVDRRKSGVITLDVGPAVERWVRKPATNNGLVLEMVPSNSKHHTRSRRDLVDMSHLKLKRDTSSEEEYWHEIRPSVLVFSDSGQPKQRKKRSKPVPAPYEKCQRHSLYVDFELVDWRSWIVAPRGFPAFFCDGECEFPLVDHMNTTNHAIIQTLVNSRYPNRVPKSCCIPTELSPYSLLYVDEFDNVVLKNYQNMVVEACGCR